MKIRNGFVSNSSSSSFVIHIREFKLVDTGKKKRVRYPAGITVDGKKSFTTVDFKQVSTPLFLTEQQMDVLKERGYKFCGQTYPSRVEEGVVPDEKHPTLATHMYLQGVCNEAEEVELLVEHGIPFEASVHYGHYSVFFQRGKNRVYTARNLGRAIETYKNIAEEFAADDKMLRYQTVESIMKEGWSK